VVIGDRVIALVGGPGAGKTSLALHLVASGARLFADDVLALELSGKEVIAHPGVGVVNLNPAERDRLNGLIEDEHVAGVNGQELRVVVERATRPLKLAAVYFIDRPDAATRVSFERLDSSERTLGATFNLSIREPARLRRHLDVCAAIASRCGQYRVGVPGSVPAAELASAVAGHAAGVS
jgi:serine kinase of HPr protein (carbohydrate metabolism regulator)